MMVMTLLAIVLGGVWGLIWAVVLQKTYVGKFMAARLTWLTVVVGIGVDLFIVLLVAPLEMWLQVVAVIAASSVAIIVRSIWNEVRDAQQLVKIRHEHEDAHSE